MTSEEKVRLLADLAAQEKARRAEAETRGDAALVAACTRNLAFLQAEFTKLLPSSSS